MPVNWVSGTTTTMADPVSAVHRPRLGFGLAVAVFAMLIVGMLGLPRETAPLPAIARQALTIALPVWKTTEPVNEIVYGTRGFDTFGETFILLAAVVSVITLTRSREPRREYLGEAVAAAHEQRQVDPAQPATSSEREARSAEEQEEEPQPEEADRTALGAPAPERAEAMTVVIRVAARIAAVMLAVTGLYLVAWGYSPGGGFPAGAALAGVAVLLYAALGYRAVRAVIRPPVLEPLELAGAAAIILIALGGLVWKGSLTANWIPLAEPQTIRSGGIIQPFSVSELVEVGTGITLAIFALLSIEHDWTPDENDGDE
jgi:multicomponent Na+:H+ antiporter subunit B